MKTIYNLQIGDSYWSKSETTWATLKTLYNTIIDEDHYQCYQNELKYGKAFMTEEECQWSIDHDVALAKIIKRGVELGLHRGTSIYLLALIYEDQVVEFTEELTLSGAIDMETYKCYMTIIDELREEVEIVLEVD